MKIGRRQFLTGAAAAAVFTWARPLMSAETAPSANQSVPWYGNALVVDGCGSPAGISTDPNAPLSEGMIQEVRNSGVTCINLTVGPVANRPELEAVEGIFRDIGSWETELDHHADLITSIKKFGDIAIAKSSGKIGLIYGLQDGVAFETDLTRLEMLYAFGIRIIQPTYNIRNLLGDGCLEKDNAGLSKTGFEAVKRMNELGILVDLSHCGRKTTSDAVAASTKPVAFTHTGCSAVADHPRNKTDEQLKALANRGGVAGIYFMPYLRTSGQPKADDLIGHIEHAINVAGEDHVGLGTDGGVPAVQMTPEFIQSHREEVEARKKAGIGAPGESADVYNFLPDLNTSRRFETLATLLMARGHSQSRCEKLLGGNFARVFKEAW